MSFLRTVCGKLRNALLTLWAGTLQHFFLVMILLGLGMFAADFLELPLQLAAGWLGSPHEVTINQDEAARASTDWPRRIAGAWHMLTAALITGGFFSVSLKSLQYMNVFREEIANFVRDPAISQPARNLIGDEVRANMEAVLFDPEFLKRSPNKRDLWAKASRAFFENLFEGHNASLEETMFNTFFPEDGSAYNVESFQLKICIHRHSMPHMLRSEEDLSFILRPKSPSQEVRVRYRGDGDGHSEIKITRLTVNNVDHSAEVRTERQPGGRTGHKTVVSYDFPKTNENLYVVNRVIHRLHPMVDGNEGSLRQFSYRSFIKDIAVEVTYPEDLAVFVLSCGTIRELEEIGNPDSPETGYKTLRKRYDGILFPGQGFLLHWVDNRKGSGNDAERG